MSDEPQREMTLQEYMERLPKSHGARKEFEELKADGFFLSCLNGAGVDNWDGYQYAVEAVEAERKRFDVV